MQRKGTLSSVLTPYFFSLRSLSLATAGALVAVASPASADWPHAAHDAQRTGVAVATADIDDPAVYWKAYVGGSIQPTGFLSGDVTGDGSVEIVYVSGGAVIAKKANGALVWQTPPRDLQAIYAIDDFDGDGKPDVLAGGLSQAFLLSGKDGTFEWAESANDFGALGALRVADLNGDGRPDVIAEACQCCAITNGGAIGYAYSFARSGNAVVASKLWAMPSIYSCGVPTVLFDGAGDGHVEIAHASATNLWVLGSDGTVLVDSTRSPTLGTYVYYGDCVPANVDGAPGDELVCFQRLVSAGNPSPRQVAVLHYNAKQSPPSLQILWENTTLADLVGGDLDFQPDAIVDLDGNGTLEVVVSGMRATGVWTTYIFDGKTGATLATIPNARTAGTAPLRVDGKVNVLTSDGQNLTAWVYDAAQSNPLTKTWTQNDRRPITRVDATRLRTMRANLALVAPDLNKDGVPDLAALTVSPGSILYGYSAPKGTATQLGKFPFPTDVDPVGTWVVPGAGSTLQIASVANDGLLRIFDGALNPDASIRVGGFCSGGVHQSPVVASFGGVGGTQSVFASDSRGALLRFDAQNASLANPPKPQWSVRNCTSPSFFPGIDGARPGIVCRGAQQPISYPPNPAISAVRGDGSFIWNSALNGEDAIYDALPGTPDSSGAPAVLFQTRDTVGQLRTRSLSGSTGLPGWSSTPVVLERGVFPFSAADWNSDGVVDVIGVMNSVQAISGANGATLIDGGTFLAYGVPILKDVNADGVLDATLQGSSYPSRTLQHDLTTPIWVGGDTKPYPTGGIADCPSESLLVEGSTAFPSRIYFTPVSGKWMGTSTSAVFAGGKRYVDETAATAAGAYLATLSDLSIGTNVTGAGHPSAVVGSSDGWVYAIDACSGSLQFALQLNESVCGTVFGDTNADGRDEILVSTSGGYIYDIQDEEVQGCGHVLDTDPPNGIVDKNVDQIVSKSTLFGAWQASSDAASYEVAVVHNPEGIISDPQWQDVGKVTSASVTGLPLVVGETYYFAVRAVNAQGRSPDSLSDGVKVVDRLVAPPMGGQGLPPEPGSPTVAQGAQTGCGCRTAGTGGSGGLALLLGGALAGCFALRRRFR
jgi:hypothetical protein